MTPEQTVLHHPAFRNDDCDRTIPSATAIEAPYRLYLSPLENTVWQHSSTPESNATPGVALHRTVLWHTTLRNQNINRNPRARAVWNADYSRDQITFLMPLDSNDRNTIVQYTTGMTFLIPNEEAADEAAAGMQHILHSVAPAALQTTQKFAVQSAAPGAGAHKIIPPQHNTPTATPATQPGITVNTVQIPYVQGIPTIELDQLTLSSLGAWLKAHLSIDEINHLPTGYSMRQWDHIMAMGRDSFVRVIYEGTLFPFGHRAVLIKITQRIPKKSGPASGNGATYTILHQKEYIVVKEPLKTYQTLDFPFTQIRLKTLVTHSLTKPLEMIVPSPSDPQNGAFWINCANPNGTTGEPFYFHCEGLDIENRPIEFSIPMIFVDKTVTDAGASTMNTIVTTYQKDIRNTSHDLNNVELAFTPPDAQGRGDGRLRTSSITFGGAVDAQPYRPTMAAAQVFHSVIGLMRGNCPVLTVAWEPTYLQSGTNAGDIFLRIVNSAQQTAQQLQFPDATTGGGMLSPTLPISGFSRLLGPVSLPAGTQSGSDLASGHFDPLQLFKQMSINILRAFSLSDILQIIDFTGPDDAGFQQLPSFKGNKDKVTFAWQTQKLGSTPVFVNNQSTLSITTEIDKPASPAPSFTTIGKLTNFGLALKGDSAGIEVDFNSLTFTSQNGSKPSISVAISAIKYFGFLEYIANIIQSLPADIFGGNGPSVNVDPQDITIGMSLSLPDIGVGVFDLQHIRFKTAFMLSFLDLPPAFEFDFADKADPFILTVIGIGGGGYFSLLLSSRGIENITLALEFGACVAIDLGVASGSLSIMGGLQVNGGYQAGKTVITITAFIQANGELDVLGLISVSVTFYLGLTYQTNTGTLEGDATISVSISILFFSTTVGIHMHKTLKGSDPTFQDAFSANDWIQYCDAFAF